MNLIVMLTKNDVTVSNAKEVFLSCTDIPVNHWGFKDVGLPTDQMKDLVKTIKNSGKNTYLEVVTYTEAECIDGAKLAVDCDFDYLMGTTYFASVAEILKKSNTKYLPFCGKVWGSPSVLGDTVEDIVASAKLLQEKDVDGIDILAYRFTGDVKLLLSKYFKEVSIPTIITGSIDTFEKIDYIKSINPWGFTMGSALFNQKFVQGANVHENLQSVYNYLTKIIPS